MEIGDLQWGGIWYFKMNSFSDFAMGKPNLNKHTQSRVCFKWEAKPL